MRRFMVLVTAALLATAMVMLTAFPASAAPPTCTDAASTCTIKGVAVNPIVCETPASVAPNIGWRNGTCWVFLPSGSP